MIRKLSLITLLLITLIGNGCSRPLMELLRSNFLTNFSLEDLVKKNNSPAGKLCAAGGLRSIGGGGGVGPDRTSSDQHSKFSCQIKTGAENSFDQVAFLASLKADVERQIVTSGAQVTGQGDSGSAGFYFEYREHDIHGRVEILGVKNGANLFVLQAKLAESREAQAK
jgi:hypothetical protein